MKMMITIMIIIIIARFSKIQIHLKSIKKVKQRISLERRRLARLEVLIAYVLCVKVPGSLRSTKNFPSGHGLVFCRF